MTTDHPFIPHRPPRLDATASVARGRELLAQMDQRRSVRHFSADPIPRECIELAIRIASTAPSGAHMQPWTFVVVDDPALKRQIREAAEEEERTSYGGRMSEEWLRALEPLGTSWEKPFLETAPYLVVVFEQTTGVQPDGRSRKHYYVRESVGIACGFFIAALHQMGLCTLTHTPSPMGFLAQILDRPGNERPYILFPIGYPDPEAMVPALRRKSLDEVCVWNQGK